MQYFASTIQAVVHVLVELTVSQCVTVHIPQYIQFPAEVVPPYRLFSSGFTQLVYI